MFEAILISILFCVRKNPGVGAHINKGENCIHLIRKNGHFGGVPKKIYKGPPLLFISKNPDFKRTCLSKP